MSKKKNAPAPLMIVGVKEGLKGLKNPQDGSELECGKVYEVPKNQFWLRRLRDKDIFETERPKKEAPKEIKKGGK